ncbi:MAG TPA: hypothetical protein VK973_09210 [Arenicellales bacterium]|nr:hypothetical protein [Arenicellales bacterium]
MVRRILRFISAIGLVFVTGSVFGHSPPRTDLQRPEAFLETAFAGQVPEPAQIWMTGHVARRVETILGHNPRWLRLPYWKRDGRTAWVLEESLDGAPVTVGVVVEDAQIAHVNVLTYGARHGRDVTRPGFLKQFEGASLTDHDQLLDRSIRDTMSIGRPLDLVVGLARLALYLTDQVPPAGGSGSGSD